MAIRRTVDDAPDDVDECMKSLIDKFGVDACRDSLDKWDAQGGGRKQSISEHFAHSAVVFEAILDSCFDACLVTDTQGMIVHVNEAALYQFGYVHLSDLLGEHASKVIKGPLLPQNDSKNSNNTDAVGGVVDWMKTVIAKRADGVEFHTTVGIKIIETENHKKLFVMHCHDLTKYRKQMNEIQEKQEINQSILDSSFDSIIVTDEVGEIRIANQTTLKMFGYINIDEIIGKNISMLVGGGHSKNHETYMTNFNKRKAMSSLLGKTRDVLAQRKDGSQFPCNVGIQRVKTTTSTGQQLMVGFIRDVSVEKEARKKIAQNEKLNQSILDTSFDSIVVTDEKGLIQTVNKTTLNSFGFEDASEIVGKNVSVLVGGGHAKKHDSYMANFKKRGATSTVLGVARQSFAQRKDGTQFPCRVGLQRVSTMMTTEGQQQLMVGFIHDISDEKEAMENLQKQRDEIFEKEQLNQSILDSSFDSIIVTDEIGEIRIANQTTLDIFGYSNNDEIIGKNISMLVGGGHSKNHETYMTNFKKRKAMSSLLGKTREVLGQRKDGSQFPCNVGIQRVQTTSSTGEHLLVGFIRDVTAEKEAMKKIAYSEQLNQSILDTSFDSIIVTDEKGFIQTVNKTTLTSFGFEAASEIVGRNVSVLVGGGHAKKHDSYMANFNKRGTTSTVLGISRESFAQRKDGTQFPCRVGLQRVNTTMAIEGQGQLMVGFVHDISAEKEAIENLQKQRDEILEKEQLNQSILDSSFDSIIVTDITGVIQTVNERTLTTFGFEDVKDLIGKNVSMLVGGDHSKNHAAYMHNFNERKAMSTVLGRTREALAVRKNGSHFPCKIGVQKVKASQKQLMVGYVRDITAEKAALALSVEKKIAEDLLMNMLPEEIAGRLKTNKGQIADNFTRATVLFGDIVGFTKMSNNLTPVEVVTFLNDIFSRFDQHLDRYGLNKVKTIGDCYMVTCCPNPENRPHDVLCASICYFAMDMIKELEDYNAKNPGQPLHMRIGINNGPVVAGVVGTKRFLYDIWGDAVNVASRMESTGVKGKVQVTQSVVDAVKRFPEFKFEKRGKVQVKGIGEMDTYFLETINMDSQKSDFLNAPTNITNHIHPEPLTLLQSPDQLE